MSLNVSRSACALGLLVLAGTALGQHTGPSTTTAPYVLPVAPGVSTTSILTVGDSIGGYRMVGIPDGTGAFSNGDGTFTFLVSHEIGGTVGSVRAHGQTGAFVSRWNINANGGNLVVNSGRDFNTSSADAYEFSNGAWSNDASSLQRWSRFCSGDLAAPTAYAYTDPSGTVFGTSARLYLSGEEAGAEGRAYANIATGPNMNQSWHLPHLGRFSWENAVANPLSQRNTVVIGTDDSSPGQVYLYVGQKTNSGNDIERAGLTNGNLFGVRVNGTPSESRTNGIAPGTRFDLFQHGDVSLTSGAALQTQSTANGVTEFLRPEDGAWDARPGQENNFYFVTTDRFNNEPSSPGRSRLWRMTFDDITNPTAGGTLTALLDGDEGGQMFDNLCIDSHGRILIQEDPGNNAHLAKIWLYDITTGGFGVVAQHDSRLFVSGAPGYLGTQDEEASGIIDARDILGDGWFLLSDQVHAGLGGELVERGQLAAMYIDPSVIPAPGAAGLLGLAGIAALRRRRA